jgi:hypothetical protein
LGYTALDYSVSGRWSAQKGAAEAVLLVKTALTSLNKAEVLFAQQPS